MELFSMKYKQSHKSNGIKTVIAGVIGLFSLQLDYYGANQYLSSKKTKREVKRRFRVFKQHQYYLLRLESYNTRERLVHFIVEREIKLSSHFTDIDQMEGGCLQQTRGDFRTPEEKWPRILPYRTVVSVGVPDCRQRCPYRRRFPLGLTAWCRLIP